MSTASLSLERTALRKSGAALRTIFSFPAMLIGFLCVLAVLTVRSRFDDPDMWWHLKTGQVIWTTHSIPTSDIFSFTTGHHAWVPHEWLSQVLIYGAYRLGGYTGLMLWLCLFTSVLLIAGYALCTLCSGNAKVAFLGAMTIWLFATAGVAVRPQMAGYCLLTIELLLLHLGRTRNSRWFFLLPPLFAVWVNCHGSFFLGFVLAGITLACSFFRFEAGSLVALPWAPRRRTWLAWSMLLSTAALFLNPIGLRQILYPLDTMLHQQTSMRNVEEWMPLQMNSGRGEALLLVLAAIFLLVIVRRSQLFLDELVTLSLAVWLAAGHQRMVFVFGILVAPVLSRLLADCWDGYDAAHDLPWLNGALMAICVLIVFLGFPAKGNLAEQVDAGSPVQAVNYLKNHPMPGRMLNDYVFGGYLIWSAPQYPVFIDGRGDVFDWTGILTEYGAWATLQSAPSALLDKHNISICLLARTSPMARVLPLMQGWKMVYSDRLAVIFARTAQSM